jgi:antitoxin component of MazEF toxin-antitoxin module
MTVIKTLTKHGNSLALILDKPILDLLNIDLETPLVIRTDGYTLVISPSGGEERAERLKRVRARVNEKYASTFRKLAD